MLLLLLLSVTPLAMLLLLYLLYITLPRSLLLLSLAYLLLPCDRIPNAFRHRGNGRTDGPSLASSWAGFVSGCDREGIFARKGVGFRKQVEVDFYTTLHVS